MVNGLIKKEPNAPRRKGTYLAWTKDEEYALAWAWLDISEDPEVVNYKTSPFLWNKIRETFFKAMGKDEYQDKDSKSSKWTNINQKCHQFQEVFQRTRDNWGNGQNDAGILTRMLEEYNKTRGVFTYLRCWELLRGSPKWCFGPFG
ncbi:glutathione S-transferase T3-like [Helianthus annuus]|uniref:glutathione S-transferase T3-like n=1 Tax=Helianthus annuus TaxID=4232 RepID=UPI000B8F2A6D|nr:glutathione S-transferase T3-like [Helianthus annuus]